MHADPVMQVDEVGKEHDDIEVDPGLTNSVSNNEKEFGPWLKPQRR